MPPKGSLQELLTQDDLQALIDSQVPEGKEIDYKQEVVGGKDADKKEFLADVSSFANAAGGHLILGIEEVDGLPVRLPGVRISNVDAEISRLENVIRQGLAPRIPAVSIKSIPLKPSGVAIVLRIPRSWAMPHMVTYGGHSRFYSRNSAGKCPLDVGELRALFNLSATITQEVRRFRAERLGQIVSGETPVPLGETAKIVLHLVPLHDLSVAPSRDLSKCRLEITRLGPMYSSGWEHRYNFDGFLTYTRLGDSPSCYTYLQIFRNGSIEAVESELLLGDKDDGKVIPSLAFEKELLQGIPRFLSIQDELLAVDPPVVLMLSLLGISGYIMDVSRQSFGRRVGSPIEKETLVLPEVVIEDFQDDAATFMRPIFDTVWNAAGWPRSKNYDNTGKWTGG